MSARGDLLTFKERFLWIKKRLSRGRTLKLLVFFMLINLLILYVIFSALHSGEEKMERRPHLVIQPVYKPNKWIIFPQMTEQTKEADVCFMLNNLFHDWNAVTYTSNTASFVRCRYDGFRLRHIADSFIEYLTGAPPERIGDSLGRTKAYVTAIRGKADFIYVAENLTDIINMNRLPFSLSPMYEGLTHPGDGKDFNPLVHFGCDPTIQTTMGTRYKLCAAATPALQANAYHSLTNSRVKITGRNACSEQAPPLVINRTSSPLPLDLHNALYKKEIFWALPIMKIVDERQKALWNYFIQLCITEASHHIQLNTIIGRTGEDLNTSSDYINDQVSTRIRTILKASQMKKAGDADNFTYMFAKLLIHGYMTLERAKEHGLWIRLLRKLEVISEHWRNPQPMTCSHELMYRPWYRPNKLQRKKSHNLGIQNLNIVRNTFNMICPNTKMRSYEIGKYPRKRYSKIALVIIYKHPDDVSVPFIEMLYRSHFPIIVHCSPKLKDNPTEKRFEYFTKAGWEFIFVQYLHDNDLSYECISLVLHLRLPVSGYLFIGNDVIFSPYALPKLSLKTPWLSPSFVKCPTKTVGGVCNQWSIENIEKMKHVYDTLNRNMDPLALRCAKNLEILTGNSNWFVGGESKVFYLPHSLSVAMETFLPLYLSNKIHVDIAVPNLIHCLTGESKIQNIQGIHVKEDNEDSMASFQKLISGNYEYLHPVRWGNVTTRSKRYLEMFCNDIVYFYHKRNMK